MDDLRDFLEVEYTAILTGGGSNPTLELTYPVGGEGLSFGKTYNITWESSGLSTVKIEYSGNNGGSWSTLAASVNALLGTWSWTINQAETDLALIKISSGALSSQSGSVFSVLLETVTIVQPDGGESAVKGSTYDITWTYNDISAVKVELSTDNKVSWSTLSASVAASALKYTWSVTQARSIGQCFVRLTDAGGSGASDVSAAAFNIIEPTIAITDPDGGETWYTGEIHPITWNVQDITGTAILYYNKSAGADIKIDDVADVTTGTYNWTLPADASTEVKVKLVCGSYNDSSAAYFTIAIPSITVTAPDGGESLTTGDSFNVTWTSVGITGDVTIAYSIDNGASYTDITTVAYDSSPYAWTIPVAISTTCLVKIEQGAISDQSAATFNIFLGTVQAFIIFQNDGTGAPKAYEVMYKETLTKSYTLGNMTLSNGYTGSNNAIKVQGIASGYTQLFYMAADLAAATGRSVIMRVMQDNDGSTRGPDLNFGTHRYGDTVGWEASSQMQNKAAYYQIGNEYKGGAFTAADITWYDYVFRRVNETNGSTKVDVYKCSDDSNAYTYSTTWTKAEGTIVRLPEISTNGSNLYFSYCQFITYSNKQLSDAEVTTIRDYLDTL